MCDLRVGESVRNFKFRERDTLFTRAHTRDRLDKTFAHFVRERGYERVRVCALHFCSKVSRHGSRKDEILLEQREERTAQAMERTERYEHEYDDERENERENFTEFFKL